MIYLKIKKVKHEYRFTLIDTVEGFIRMTQSISLFRCIIKTIKNYTRAIKFVQNRKTRER